MREEGRMKKKQEERARMNTVRRAMEMSGVP